MGKYLRIGGIVLLSAVLLAAAGFGVNHWLHYEKAEEIQMQAVALAQPQPSSPAPVLEPIPPGEPQSSPEATEPAEPDPQALELSKLNTAALQEKNPDVLGWIRIPGTQIDHPLLSSDSADEYLHTAWDGSYSYSGSIYLEQGNSRDLMDFHTIIYGHNMKNGTMFGNLVGYGDDAFWKEHPYVYVRSGDTVHRYEVFAAYTASIESDTYRIAFSSPERKEKALSYYLQNADFPGETELTAQSRILTLSTCTGYGDDGKRWVVQAVCTGSWKIEN